jgi:3-deoxy-7-phosphoheptulonate synthase
MKYKTDDLRISGVQEVIPPEELHREYPLSERASDLIYHTRQAIHEILHGHSDRVLVIVGPCSIHDPRAGREYATRLKKLIDELHNELCIVMRVYFEKPRTTVGWKGLINDPHLDDSYNINYGLRLARSFLLDVNEMGVPAGTEYLDLISPQYIADLVSWGAIGARTTESQGHRELASGLSCPVGFKNGTDGNLKIAIDAIHAASRPHVFMSLTKQGHSAIFSTTGNDDCHVILRGGKKPNYDAASVNEAAQALEKSGLHARLMVDCSHANSGKDHTQQAGVCRNVAGQIAGGDQRIFGIMLESHLVAGRQDVKKIDDLIYGQSVTDACMGWDESEGLLRELAAAVKQRRAKK